MGEYTHFDADGRPTLVDVSGKSVTKRTAWAEGWLYLPDEIKCMQCNGSSFSTFATPKWWYEFEKRAREELIIRPTSETIFELEFLAAAANAASCQRCAGSVLDSWRFLQSLKSQIDELPSTI